MTRWGKRDVKIVQRVLPHYRIEFFRMLHDELALRNIGLSLFYGRENTGSVPRTVPMVEEWAVEVPTRYFNISGQEAVWQSLPRVGGSQLIIVEHAGRLLNNYVLTLARARRQMPRLAFWGHGGNFQAEGDRPLSDGLKGVLARRADHWFAYTELSRERLLKLGVSHCRITVVNNAVDTGSLKKRLASVTDAELTTLRQELGIVGEQVGIYCGGLREDKRIDFLLAAAHEIRRAVPDFELIVIGDGPEADKVRAAAGRAAWIKYVGAVFGEDVVPYYRLARCLLMPGMVGLVVVDAFALGVPLVTTDNGLHSPEIAYLRSGKNGLMSANTMQDFVSTVIGFLGDRKLQGKLVEGCHEAGREITLQNMVGRFARGVTQCLDNA